MSSDLFRKKSIERVSSPEQLNDYVRVSSPGVWAVLAAVLILLAGAFVWGILGRLEATVPAVVISRDGAAVCCYGTAYGAEVGAGMPVRVGGEELSLVSVSSEAVQLGADAPEAGFDAGQYVYVSELSGSVGDGVYEAEIVVDSIAPLSFLWN